MNIQPINVSGEPIIIRRNIKFITIRIMDLQFNNTATLSIDFYDDFSNIIKNEILHLTQYQYNLWGSNDNYIIELVCQAYNLKLTSPGRI